MFCAMQLGYTFDADGGGASAFNVCSHLDEQIRQINDLRLARAVLHDGIAISQRRGHEQVFCAGYADFVEGDFAAAQAIRLRFDVAVLDRHRRAEAFQSLNVQIDGARANGAASGQRHASASEAGDQRTQHERGGAHCLNQFVRGFGIQHFVALNNCAVLRFSVAQFDGGTHRGQQVALGLNVANLRNVFQNDLLVGKESGSH